MRHLHGLLHHHGYQVLGAGHNDDAIHRQRLKHVQRHVAGAGRHIHEHIIHIVPQGITPELLHHAADDRPAPDDRVRLVLQQQVHGHQLDAGGGGHGHDGVALRHGPAMDAEGLGDGGAGDVRVQNGGAIALPPQRHRQLAGDHGLAYAALAGHHAVDPTYAAAGAEGLFLKYVYFLALAAAFAAGAAIMGAIAHNRFSF